jgi:hypothetical protein
VQENEKPAIFAPPKFAKLHIYRRFRRFKPPFIKNNFSCALSNWKIYIYDEELFYFES